MFICNAKIVATSGSKIFRNIRLRNTLYQGVAASIAPIGHVPEPLGTVFPAGLERRLYSGSSGTGQKPSGPVSFASLGLTLATGTGLYLAYNHLKEGKIQEATGQKTVSAGKANVGGPFSLTDQDGRRFSDKDLRGSYALLYFGFCTCPDICPDELEKLTAAVNAVEKRTGRFVQPVFITVDPERDNVKRIKSYVREFHPRMIGLTGSGSRPLLPRDSPSPLAALHLANACWRDGRCCAPAGTKEEIDVAAKAYRVYYMKTDESDDYLIDHSIIMYLLDPNGDFVTFFGKNFTEEQLADKLASIVAEPGGDSQDVKPSK